MTTGKRDKPFWLDMSFDEAMRRFAKTDPSEADQNSEAEANKRRISDADAMPIKKDGRAARKQTRPR